MSLLIGTSAGAYRLDDGPEEILGGTRINHINTDDGSVWIADGKGRIHRDGEVVADMPDGAPALCVQPGIHQVFVGSSEARLFTVESGSPVEDEFFANAPGREAWYTPWGAPADIRSMATDVDTTLYINVHVGGIIRYDNTGLAPTLDINADVHQVATHPRLQGAVFAACAYGLATSHNGHDFEISDTGLHASYSRAVTVLDDTVLVSASTGPRTTRGRLYRRGLWEGEIEPLLNGLPEWFDGNLNTHCLVSSDGAVFAGHGDSVWRSDDDGDSWEVAATGLPKVTCLA